MGYIYTSTPPCSSAYPPAKDMTTDWLHFAATLTTPKSLLAKTHNRVLDEDNIASKELSALYKKTGLEAMEVMKALEKKHQPIKDYFYKGKLAGQII